MRFSRLLSSKRPGRRSPDKKADSLLSTVFELLAVDIILLAKYHDHPLKGAWSGYRDLHIKPLIYRKIDNERQLVCIGSHRGLFKFLPASCRLFCYIVSARPRRQLKLIIGASGDQQCPSIRHFLKRYFSPFALFGDRAISPDFLLYRI